MKAIDVVSIIGAAAALFASVQSWSNGRQLAQLSGAVGVVERTVQNHVNTPHVFVQAAPGPTVAEAPDQEPEEDVEPRQMPG